MANETYAVFDTTEGRIKIKLLANEAPKTVQNFVDLASKKMPEKLVLCGTGSSFTFTA